MTATAAAAAAWTDANEALSQPSAPEAGVASPAGSTDGVVPPQLLGEALVEYPAGAHGAATVLIELLIARDGIPEAVRAVSGDEPFSSAAIAAARAFRFAPATRRGEEVRARIRMELRFAEPVPEEAAPASAPAPTETEAPGAPPRDPAPSTDPAQKPTEVFVHGRRSASEQRLTRAEVRQLPGAFGDPFRAVEILPGVTPIAAGLPYFYVRGSPPGNVGYYFDDIPVPGLYHVAAGPAVIHPSFVEDVRLYSGAYPSRYGRFAGAIIAANAAPPQYRFHGEASVRLVDAGALVEAPFAGSRGSATVAGRYSYTGAVVSLLAPGVEVGYWDYQTRAQYRLTPRDVISVLGFGAYDFLSAEDDDGEIQDIYDVTFHRLDLRYDRLLGTSGALRVATTLGLDRTTFRRSTDIHARRVRNRFRLTQRLGTGAQLRAGGDVEAASYDIDLEPDAGDQEGRTGSGLPRELDPRPLPGLPPRTGSFPSNAPDRAARRALFASRSDVATGAYAELELELGAGVTLTPGFRLDVYMDDGVYQVAPEPRIGARLRVSDGLALVHDLGVAHQPPSFAVPVPGFQGAAKEGLQRGVQSSAGAEVDLGARMGLNLTLFQSVLFGGTDPLGVLQLQRADSNVDNDTDRVTAHTYGLEVLVRRPLTERLGGFLSYTLSRSTRSVGRLHGPATFDRTHVVNLALGYELGRAWRAGIRTAVYTGIPAELAYPSAALKPPRAPFFYRLDWRLEKRWPLGKEGFWAFVVEVLNTTLHEETLELSCYAYGCSSESIGPVTIPSIGLEASF